MHDRVDTRSRLKRKGIFMNNNDCILCQENTDELLCIFVGIVNLCKTVGALLFPTEGEQLRSLMTLYWLLPPFGFIRPPHI